MVVVAKMPSRGCRPRAMRFITTKQAALGSILLEDGSDILLGRSANPLANIHTEVPSAASSLPHLSPSPFSQSVAFPSRPKLLILVSPTLCSTANSICGLVTMDHWIIPNLSPSRRNLSLKKKCNSNFLTVS